MKRWIKLEEELGAVEAPEGFWLVDLEDNTILTSEDCLSMYGKSEDEVLKYFNIDTENVEENEFEESLFDTSFLK